MKYFPDIPEDVLRREWQHYRHVEPDFNKWLKFMHEERGRDGQPAKKEWSDAPVATVLMIAFVAFAVTVGMYLFLSSKP